MKIARVPVTGALILVLGAVTWIGVSQLVGIGPAATATGLVASVQEDKQSFLDGIRGGQPLYFKVEKYKRNRLGPSDYPDRVIDETWLRAGEDGSIETAVAKMLNLEGEMLGYTQLNSGVLEFTDVATGMTFDINVDHWDSLESSVSEVWNRLLEIQGQGVDFKGRGRLNQRESLIYEWRYTSQGGPDDGTQRSMLKRIELVEDTPLFFKESLYEIDNQEVRTLLEESTMVEFRLLPEGSTVPTVAGDRT